MNLPKKVNCIDEGTYEGTIIRICPNKTMQYVYFTIDVYDINVMLTVSISVDYSIYNNFISNYEDEEGNINSDTIVGQKIKFKIINKQINEQTYSKFASIEKLI